MSFQYDAVRLINDLLILQWEHSVQFLDPEAPLPKFEPRYELDSSELITLSGIREEVGIILNKMVVQNISGRRKRKIGPRIRLINQELYPELHSDKNAGLGAYHNLLEEVLALSYEYDLALQQTTSFVPTVPEDQSHLGSVTKMQAVLESIIDKLLPLSISNQRNQIEIAMDKVNNFLAKYGKLDNDEGEGYTEDQAAVMNVQRDFDTAISAIKSQAVEDRVSIHDVVKVLRKQRDETTRYVAQELARREK